MTSCMNIRRKPRNVKDIDVKNNRKKRNSEEGSHISKHGNNYSEKGSRKKLWTPNVLINGRNVEGKKLNDCVPGNNTKNDMRNQWKKQKDVHKEGTNCKNNGGNHDGERVRRQSSGSDKADEVTTDSSAAPSTMSSDDDDETPLVNQTQSFNELMNFMALYANFSEELRSAMGHDGGSFIRSCTFSGKSCSNVTVFFKPNLSSAFGNCFTFTTTRKTVMPGRDYGLSMELFLDQFNYIGGGLSPRAGARVVVHPPTELPLPDENGLTIPPHTATSMALMKVDTTREKLPYETNCTSGWERTWYERRVGGLYKYSMERCQRICLQLAFEEVCSCTHPSYMDLPTGASPCNLTSENQNYACASQVLEEFESGSRTCSCNMDCREVTYEMKVSQALWPNENNWCDVAQQFGMAQSCKHESYRSEYQIRERQRVLQNILTVDVFFENLRIQSVDQHPTYKLQTFVGSLGGALSLYLGVTLFMLLEVVEVFARLCFAIFRQGYALLYHKKSTTVQDETNQQTWRQNDGIYYTDFKTGAAKFPARTEPIKPIKFAW